MMQPKSQRGDPNYIATVQRNGIDQLRFYLGEYDGHNVFRMELWRKHQGDDHYLPRHTLTSVRAGKLPELERVITRARHVAEQKGWCDAR